MLSMLPLSPEEKAARGLQEKAIVFTAVERGQELGFAAADIEKGILLLDVLHYPGGDSAVADGLARAVLNAAMEQGILKAVINAPINPDMRQSLYHSFDIETPFSIALFFTQLRHCKG